MSKMATEVWAATRRNYDRYSVWCNREPVLTIRRVLWVLTGGLWLALLYCVAAFAMAASLVFIPFALQALRIALFALDGGITLEPVAEQYQLSFESSAWSNPAHPFTIAANVVWAVLFGWALVLAHLTAALIQALTIVGISTALTNVKLATFIIWPFGRSLQRKPLPTTVEELHQLRATSELEASSQRALSRSLV